VFLFAHLSARRTPESFAQQLGFGLWPVLVFNSFASAVVILEVLALVYARVERLLLTCYWRCVAACGVGCLLLAIAAAWMPFNDSGGFVPDEACLGELRDLAGAGGYGERELGGPVALERVSEVGGLWGGLGCAVFRARGAASAGLVGIAAERRGSRCVVSFWRVQPPDSVSCEALDAEAQLRLTDLSP
jgi:hypothetical protein